HGRLIPKWMLDLARHGNLNLHGSLLPKYRGAAPIQWAIANGERVTGVTTMRLDEGLDTGDILLQKEIAIAPEDTAVTLAPRRAEKNPCARLRVSGCVPKRLAHDPADAAGASLLAGAAESPPSAWRRPPPCAAPESQRYLRARWRFPFAAECNRYPGLHPDAWW